MKPKVRSLYQLSLVILLFFAQLWFVFPANAQMAIASVRITSVDSSSFPNVYVNAFIRDVNTNPVLPADLSVELLENGQQVDFVSQQIISGSEVIIVLDIGLGINALGATGQPRISEMQQVMSHFVDGMQSLDKMGIVLVNNDKPQYLFPLSSDKQALMQTIKGINVSEPKQMSSGLQGISDALLDLLQSADNKSVQQSVVLLTSGLQTTLSSSDYERLIQRANQQQINVHALLFRQEETQQQSLSNLATLTGGSYNHYIGTETESVLFDWYAKHEVQYQFKFTSVLDSSSDRTIELRGRGMVSISDTASYRVSLLPPQVQIITPTAGTVYARTATSLKENMDNVEPTSVQVTAQVKWQDGYGRDVVQAELIIDGVSVGVPVVSPGTEISLPWDLRPYRITGENSVQVQVRVRDSLGMESLSEPVLASINVVAPGSCHNQTGLSYIICETNYYSGYLSLLLVIPALVLAVLAFRNRGKIASKGREIMQKVRETFTAKTPIAGYLTILKGAEDVPTKKISLNMNSHKTIGRDRRKADIIFDEGAEKSIVSSIHCTIEEENNQFWIKDEGARNGTIVNGVRMPELGRRPLEHGDKIEIGNAMEGGVLLLFERADRAGTVPENKNPRITQ